ncbi:MAG: polyprenyl synthetase family protein [Alphaproteobacteria bacterium]|nr:polyprenyl synthetase family protein [Alphaproteobacteria bacterium]
MQSEVPLIPELAGHLVAAGGKRLRPLLTIASARMFGYEGRHHIGLAAAVEFIHTATLLHDDVVDESDLRRGRQTANAVWGNQASVLVGDFLFSRAFRLMVESESLEVLDILANASAVIAEGEVAQLTTANDLSTSEEAYLFVIRSKTAALFAAACEVGGLVAGPGSEATDALDRYGANLGVAFQLVDDYLDYAASQDKLGKEVGDDFREGKITLPVVLAMRRGNEAEHAFWRRTLEECEQDGADLENAVALLHKHDALDDTLIRARGYADTARAALSTLPDNEFRAALEDVVDFCVDRAY